MKLTEDELKELERQSKELYLEEQIVTADQTARALAATVKGDK